MTIWVFGKGVVLPTPPQKSFWRVVPVPLTVKKPIVLVIVPESGVFQSEA